MEFWKSMNGMLLVELTSAQPEQVITYLNEQNVPVYHVTWKSALQCTFCIRRQDYKNSYRICQIKGGELKRITRIGVFWTLGILLRRPVLVVGLTGMLLLSLYLPSRILFVEVEGNQRIPARQILEAAESCGIRFWASRGAVRSEKVKNNLLSAVPQLQWAGVNTAGCVATISVREKMEQKSPPDQPPVSSIAAGRDGYILSATAVRGNLLIQPGQTVQKGQLLISGYTDCGLCIRAERAEGEILAQTERKLTAVMPKKWTGQIPKGKEIKKYSLIIGKKRINLWKDSGISGVTCGRMYKEYYLTLPGGYMLPAALCVDSYQPYASHVLDISIQAAGRKLSLFAEQYLLKQMIAGQIRQTSGGTVHQQDIFILKRNYVCHEMIGVVYPEQIGDYDG